MILMGFGSIMGASLPTAHYGLRPNGALRFGGALRIDGALLLIEKLRVDA
ncbi:hypothetical protein [Marinomonas epiphytica]